MTTSGVFTETWPVEKGGAYHSCTTTALHCRKNSAVSQKYMTIKDSWSGNESNFRQYVPRG
jgi:hypothetical protein